MDNKYLKLFTKKEIKGYIILGIFCFLLAFLVIGIAVTWSGKGNDAGEAFGILVGLGIAFIPIGLIATKLIKHYLKIRK